MTYLHSNLSRATAGSLGEAAAQKKRWKTLNRLPVNKKDWPLYWYERWAERSAIIQFEAGMTQNLAEQEAERDIRKLAERGN